MILKKMRKFFILVSILLLISCTQNTNAASFDCSKASSQVEKIICSDPNISNLDTTVGIFFNSSKKDNQSLVAEQKKWLKETRNLCKTSECLKKVYSERIIILQKLDNCQADEPKILGSWLKKKGESFEEMNFSISNDIHSFVSWLHHQPEMTGTWKLDGCAILIKSSSNENLQFELKIQKIENTNLYILDTDTNIASIYKKVTSSQ